MDFEFIDRSSQVMLFLVINKPADTPSAGSGCSNPKNSRFSESSTLTPSGLNKDPTGKNQARNATGRTAHRGRIQIFIPLHASGAEKRSKDKLPKLSEFSKATPRNPNILKSLT